MGLDIFLRKGKRNVVDSNDINEIYDAFSNVKAEEYIGALKKWQEKKFRKPERAIDELYRTIKKYDGFPIGVEEWDKDNNKYVCKLKTIEDANNYANKIVSAKPSEICTETDLYYRKVNFLYAFFPPTEEEMAIIEKADAERLVEACNKVIKAYNNGNADWESVAEEELPTQSGFFFGSTDYDDWYISDVKQVRREFAKLIKEWSDGEVVVIYYSW